MSEPILVEAAWNLLVRTSLLLAVIFVCLAFARLLQPWLGAERAYLLWAALPLGLATLLLPARSSQTVAIELESMSTGTLQALHPTLASVQSAMPSVAIEWCLSLWLAGSALSLLSYVWMARRWHARFRTAPDSPAVIGLLRPLIVLPADFEQRYTPVQQRLILAHEQAHIAHRDPIWNLLFAGLHALFWFHPLVWWAHRAFRFDQELACDARALAARPDLRQTYAAALIQCNSTATASPIGCHWRGFLARTTQSHPLLERIKMLKRLTTRPSRAARFAHAFVATTLLLLITGLAWALPGNNDAANTTLPQYWVKVAILHGDKALATPIVLVTEGKAATISMNASSKTTVDVRTTEEKNGPTFRLSIMPSAAAGGLTQLKIKIYRGEPEKLVAEPVVRVASSGSIQFGDAASGIYRLNLTVQRDDGTSKIPPAAWLPDLN